MIDIISHIDISGKINTTDLFRLLKTKSKKSNKVIFTKLKNFNKFSDFCNYYLNQDFYKNINALHKLIQNFASNDDTNSSSFKTNIEQYISYSTKIILLLNLLIEEQEILNKILISSKNKLNSLKIENKIENSNQENLFNLIDILSSIPHFDIKNNSNISKSTNNIYQFKVCLNENKENSFKINDEIYDKTIKTPRFESNLQSTNEEQIENLYRNNEVVKKDSTFTLSGYIFVDEKNNNIENEKKQDENENNRPQNLLVMINCLYKKTLINAEQKIKLKEMVINKSLKIEKFYNDIYQNPNTYKEELIKEVKKLLE